MNIYCSEWSPIGVYRVVFAFECKKRNKSATRQERVKLSTLWSLNNKEISARMLLGRNSVKSNADLL